MPLTKRRACKDCGERYAQEMGLCRRCQQRRIDGRDRAPRKPLLTPSPQRDPVKP